MTTKRTAAEIFHPGVFLEEELEARGLSQLDFADITGKSPRDINLIINGKLSITPDTAICLSDALGTSEKYWLNLESDYQAYKARLKRLHENPNRSAEISTKAKLYEKCPVREMVKRGWIETSSNIEVLASRFCDFFEIPSLDAEIEFNHAAKRSGDYSEKLTPVQNGWMFRARHLARAAEVNQRFSAAKLRTCYSKLKLLTHESEEIRHIPKILAEAGIRLVIIEPLPGSKIDGATFWLSDNEPVIALSLLRDRIDNFWFTLPHELSHVEHGEGKMEAIIDLDLEAVTSELPDFEKRANSDAAEFTIPEQKLREFIIRTDPYFLEAKILGFAALHKVHPGIVVGRLQHLGKVPYRNHRKFLEKVRNIITEAAFTDGYGYTPSI